MAPRVALVHHWLIEQRGGERVLARLAEMLPGAELFTLLHDPERAPAPPQISRVHTSSLQGVPGAQLGFRALLPLLPSLYERFNLRGFDLVLSSDASVAKCLRVPDDIPHLCYCYSPPRYVHDLRELYLSESVPAALRPLARRLLRGVAERDRRAAERVTEFVAISEHVAARIENAYGRDAHVIAPPVDTQFFTPCASAPTPANAPPPASAPRTERAYLLAGHAVPYKRFEVAVDACRELDRPLVVAGGGPRFDALRARAGARTRFVDSPTDDALRTLYRDCRALLFPGEEDFGLVPVEAMACGAPVIAWGVGGAAETVRHAETGWLYALDSNGTTPQAASNPRNAPHAEHVAALAAALQAFEVWESGFEPAAAVRRAQAYSVLAFRNALFERVRALTTRA
ncbi:MAG: glycosyl transferase [Planctomycetota bacterium]|nr:MAG: glycosyl transferase [Planctomycetota bacterium]